MFVLVTIFGDCNVKLVWTQFLQQYILEIAVLSSVSSIAITATNYQRWLHMSSL